jgi:hypothetical protein
VANAAGTPSLKAVARPIGTGSTAAGGETSVRTSWSSLQQSVLLAATGGFLVLIAAWDMGSAAPGRPIPTWILPVGVGTILLAGAAITFLWGEEPSEGAVPASSLPVFVPVSAAALPSAEGSASAWEAAPPAREDPSALPLAPPVAPAAAPPAWDEGALPIALPPDDRRESPPLGAPPLPTPLSRSPPSEVPIAPSAPSASGGSAAPSRPAPVSALVDRFFRQGGVCSECLGELEGARSIPCRECGQPLCAECAARLARSPDHLRCGHVMD